VIYPHLPNSLVHSFAGEQLTDITTRPRTFPANGTCIALTRTSRFVGRGRKMPGALNHICGIVAGFGTYAGRFPFYTRLLPLCGALQPIPPVHPAAPYNASSTPAVYAASSLHTHCPWAIYRPHHACSYRGIHFSSYLRCTTLLPHLLAVWTPHTGQHHRRPQTWTWVH